MNILKNIVSYLVIILIALAVLFLITKNKYELAVAMAGILLTMFIPFFTKDLELEKHRQQLLFEKKYDLYTKYFKLFDNYLYYSKRLIYKIEHFKIKNQTEEYYNQLKQEITDLNKKVIDAREALLLPNAEFFNYVDKEIRVKMVEVMDKFQDFEFEADLENNQKYLSKNCKVTYELIALLRKDLNKQDFSVN